MKKIYDKNKELLSKQIAKDIVARAEKIGATKEVIVLGLTGGRSVVDVYNEWSASHNPIWKKVHIFIVDERLVPITDAASNFKLVYDSFAKKLIEKGVMPKENVHSFMSADDEVGDTVEYLSTLENYGGEFDIVLVSAGEDGHIASLFPHHPALLINKKKCVLLYDSPKPPSARMTWSAPVLLSAKHIALLFIGEEKRLAFKNFTDKKLTSDDCPAKIFEHHSSLMVYTTVRLSIWHL